jgi:hypothetical protein
VLVFISTLHRMSAIAPSTIASDTVLVRSGEPLAARVQDEVVMLDTRQGCYFGLDPTGSAIWELLDLPHSAEQLCAVLVERYDIAAENCLAEVLPFLRELAEAGLVEPVHTHSSAGPVR